MRWSVLWCSILCVDTSATLEKRRCTRLHVTPKKAQACGEVDEMEFAERLVDLERDNKLTDPQRLSGEPNTIWR